MEFLLILGFSVGFAKALGISSVQQVSIFIKSLISMTVVLWLFGSGYTWKNDSEAYIPEPVRMYQVLPDTLPDTLPESSSMPELDPTVGTHYYYLKMAGFYAEKHGITPSLVQGIMLQETGGTLNPQLVSPKGAAGLMQLMPGTARQYGLSEDGRFIPEKAIEVGILHLKYLRNMFNYNDNLVLAAYNAGEGNVKKHKGIPPFPETKGYVKRVNAIIGGFHFHGGKCNSIGCLSTKDGASAGGKSLPELYTLAAKIQNSVEIIWFTCFNDKYPHKGRGHKDGRAVDLTLVYPFQKDKAIQKIAEIGKELGFKLKIIDEYDNPSSRATGPHIHVEIPSVNGGEKS